MSQILNALAIGVLGAVASVLLFFGVFRLIIYCRGQSEWIFVGFVLVITAVPFISGRLLSYFVDRGGSVWRILLAVPTVQFVGFYIMSVPGGPGSRILIQLAILPCIVCTALGFYLSPHLPQREHACRECRYDLRGNESGQCPECGTSIPEEQIDKLSLP